MTVASPSTSLVMPISILQRKHPAFSGNWSARLQTTPFSFTTTTSTKNLLTTTATKVYKIKVKAQIRLPTMLFRLPLHQWRPFNLNRLVEYFGWSGEKPHRRYDYHSTGIFAHWQRWILATLPKYQFQNQNFTFVMGGNFNYILKITT